ncbi:MAG: ribose 5-phosphate isomerase B [Chloroflexota bacterium]
MRIAIGCDHRGHDAKQEVMRQLESLGHSYHDFGTYSKDSVDYPDYAKKVGEAVASNEYDLGILLCDTGIGMSMAANKVKGIRAALCCNAFYAQRARLHNNANVLCLAAGAWNKESPAIVEAFLSTQYEGGRHDNRLNKIKAMEC